MIRCITYGWMNWVDESTCKAAGALPRIHDRGGAASLSTCSINQAYETHSWRPCLPRPEKVVPSRFERKREQTPSRSKNGGRSPKLGGPRLDWVLCIRYLAIILGGQTQTQTQTQRVRAWEQKGFHCPSKRQIEGFSGRSKQASKQASTLDHCRQPAHGTRGPGRRVAGFSET